MKPNDPRWKLAADPTPEQSLQYQHNYARRFREDDFRLIKAVNEAASEIDLWVERVSGNVKLDSLARKVFEDQRGLNLFLSSLQKSKYDLLHEVAKVE